MNNYDLTLILHPSLDEEGKTAEFQKIQELIERFGGTVEKVDDWGKRKLAYEINKINEGYYSFVTFSSNPEVPAEIENRLRIMENVIRYLIIAQEG